MSPFSIDAVAATFDKIGDSYYVCINTELGTGVVFQTNDTEKLESELDGLDLLPEEMQ